MTGRLMHSIPHAAELADVSKRTIEKAIKASEAQQLGVPLLRSKLVGGRRYITDADLREWIESLP